MIRLPIACLPQSPGFSMVADDPIAAPVGNGSISDFVETVVPAKKGTPSFGG
jgi:hypothetical protein